MQEDSGLKNMGTSRVSVPQEDMSIEDSGLWSPALRRFFREFALSNNCHLRFEA